MFWKPLRKLVRVGGQNLRDPLGLRKGLSSALRSFFAYPEGHSSPRGRSCEGHLRETSLSDLDEVFAARYDRHWIFDSALIESDSTLLH